MEIRKCPKCGEQPFRVVGGGIGSNAATIIVECVKCKNTWTVVIPMGDRMEIIKPKEIWTTDIWQSGKGCDWDEVPNLRPPD